jgi:NTP pyrophosphatase (non-canonical NTP hydrolase)
MPTDEETRLYRAAIDKWGLHEQVYQALEECGELIAAIGHWRRNVVGMWSEDPAVKQAVIHEIADVGIMMEQLAQIFGPDDVAEAREQALSRLAERIDGSSLPSFMDVYGILGDDDDA